MLLECPPCGHIWDAKYVATRCPSCGRNALSGRTLEDIKRQQPALKKKLRKFYRGK